MSQPLVSIICLCYNHAPYVAQAVQSVWQQSYPHIELIVANDASTDNSQEVIQQLAQQGPIAATLFNKTNLGNTKTFNQALALAKGKYIIDLAADDLLLPQRVAIGVQALESLPPHYGVHFMDAQLINAQGQVLGTHFKRNATGQLLQKVPQGQVYTALLARHIISAPTMMMKARVLQQLGGYNEALAYEDFDFWVRSAPHWHYAFTNKVGVQKRVLSTSKSARQYAPGSPMPASTLAVCQTALAQNTTAAQNKALLQRVLYEWRQCLRHGHIATGHGYAQLYRQIGRPSFMGAVLQLWQRIKGKG